MNTNEVLNKLIAEIKRLRNECAKSIGDGLVDGDWPKTMTSGGAAWVCEQLLSFIESMEKKEAQEEILRHKTNPWLGSLSSCSGDKDTNNKPKIQGLDDATLEKARDYYDRCTTEWAKKEMLDKFPELKLDEAAEKAGLEYAPKQEGEAIDLNGDVYATDDVEWPSRCGFIQGFKAGAEWMAGQGFVYEDKVYPTSYEHEPTEFCLDGGEEIRLLTEAVNNNILKQGDKVIVQIRKK